MLVDRDEARLVALDLPCEVARFNGDVAAPALWERIEAKTGPLDHAVLNAGIGAGSPLTQTSLE